MTRSARSTPDNSARSPGQDWWPSSGTPQAVAFALQVTPSVWTLYRSRDTAGVSRGTWLLIFGELLCWGVFGIHEADPRLIVLGATGVVASLLVLARVSWPRADPAPVTQLAEVAVTAAAVTALAFCRDTAVPCDDPPSETERNTDMSWTIERRRRVTVVTMTTNPVNAQNQAFFADLHDAFDRLERDHPDAPVVLTGTGRRFSAAALHDIDDLANPLDTELPQWMTSEDALHAHRRYWQRLKGCPAEW